MVMVLDTPIRYPENLLKIRQAAASEWVILQKVKAKVMVKVKVKANVEVKVRSSHGHGPWHSENLLKIGRFLSRSWSWCLALRLGFLQIWSRSRSRWRSSHGHGPWHSDKNILKICWRSDRQGLENQLFFRRSRPRSWSKRRSRVKVKIKI